MFATVAYLIYAYTLCIHNINFICTIHIYTRYICIHIYIHTLHIYIYILYNIFTFATKIQSEFIIYIYMHICWHYIYLDSQPLTGASHSRSNSRPASRSLSSSKWDARDGCEKTERELARYFMGFFIKPNLIKCH